METSSQQQSVEQGPPVSAWAYISPPPPESQETTQRFALRALDGCLDTYLEYASLRLERGNPLNFEEIRHLVHHIKASGLFRSFQKVVWTTRPTAEQCEKLLSLMNALTVPVDYKRVVPDPNRDWLCCQENSMNGVRQFQLYSKATANGNSSVIDGPYADGEDQCKLYIIHQSSKRSTLISIGKWKALHLTEPSKGLIAALRSPWTAHSD